MRWIAAVLTLGLALPGLARAHGGEDHADARPALPAMAAEQGLAVGTTGEAFEVLVKGPAVGPGRDVPLRVFVADARTNAPIEGAVVELSFLGASEVKRSATPSGSPGIYTATVTFPSEGDWEVMTSVHREQATEILALGTLTVGGAAAEQATPHAHGVPWRVALPVGLGVVLLMAALWGAHRFARSRRRSSEVSDA